MEARFANKVVVITGAAGGIGRATAVRFAVEGASVALVDISASGLRESLAAVERVGAKGVVIEADVTKLVEVERYVAIAADRLGGIDCFFNNAGILGAVSSLTEYPEETFDRVMAVNVKSVWMGIKAVAPVMIARGGGAMVNTASVAGLRGYRNLAAYTASKHAVIGLTRTASLELARHGIRVNAICPNTVRTPMARALEEGLSARDPEAAHAKMAAAIPMKRYGEPEEVAGLVAFLCSSEAGYITGGIYTVDGGAMA